MQQVFVTGPLAWPPLLAAVAGAFRPAKGRRATLHHAATEAGDMCFPALVPGAGAVAEGWLIAISDPVLFDRLAFFAAVLGQVPVPKHVEAGGGQRAALVFMGEERPEPPPGGGWQQGPWVARWGETALAAVSEIMGYHGTELPEALHWRMPMILARAAARIAATATAAPATLRRGLRADAVQQIARSNSHAGFFLTQVHDLRHPGFDGRLSPQLRREVFVATDAAIVLPYDPGRDRLLLVEQFRMGPYGRGDPLPFVLEPVAGRVDAGETPEDTARREALEEAGLTLHALEHMTSHYCSPGCSTEYYHCYLGLADLPEPGQGRGGLETEDEDIRTHVLSFERAMALVETGEANIGPLVLMLLWLQRERPRLRSVA